MPDVFISYSRLDKAFVRRLYDSLAQKQKDVWVDWEDISYGEDWWNEIKDGIETSDAVIFVLSPNSVRSKICFDEVEHAYQSGKRIVPLLFEEVLEEADKQQMHPVLKRHNWLPFTESDTAERWLGDLLETLARDPEHVHNHTRLLTRARDWERQGKKTSLLLRGDDLHEAEAWLSTGVSKEPPPADLHAQYILASRYAESRRQRVILSSVTAALIISLALTVLSVLLYRYANRQQQIAERNAAESQSLALAASSQLALTQDNTDLAIALARQAATVNNPRLAVQRALAEAAYAPGTVYQFPRQAAPLGDLLLTPQGLITAAEDGTVILWDVDQRTEIRHFTGNTAKIWQLALSPDDQTLAAGTEATADHPGSIVFWDVESGDLVDEWQHSNSVFALAYSPDGQTLLTGDPDRLVALWEIETGEIIQRFEGHAERVRAVVFSPDGSQAVSGANDGEIIVWDIETGEAIQRLAGHTERIYQLVYQDNRMLSASGDQTLILWDMNTLEPIQTLRGHQAQVISAAFYPDGRWALSAAEDTSILLWDLQTGAVLHRFLGHTAPVRRVILGADERTFYTIADDQTIRAWDTHNGAEENYLTGHTDWVRSVSLVGEDQILSASLDGTALLRDLHTGELLLTLDGHEAGVMSAVLSPDGSLIATASLDQKVHVWDAQTGEAIQVLEGHTDGVSRAIFSPDGRYLLSTSLDYTAILWDTATWEMVRRFADGHTYWILSAAFSPDGQQLVTASADNTVLIWDVASGEVLHRLEGHTAPVRSVAVSPDGSLIMSGSRDNTVILWDGQSGQPLKTFTGHDAEVTNVAFSPDGQTAITASRDDSLIWWDVAQGTQIYRFRMTSDGVWAVAFTPDGSRVLSGSADGSVRGWRLDRDIPAILAWLPGHRYMYALTCSERDQYQVEPLCE